LLDEALQDAFATLGFLFCRGLVDAAPAPLDDRVSVLHQAF
jgi:hypothetical protein